MKGLLISSTAIFLVAMLFRLLHWPFSGILAIFSISLIFIFAIVNSIRQKKVWKIDALSGWLIASWSLYILFRYMYWYAGPSIIGFNSMFLGAILLTIIYLVISIKNESKEISKIVVVTSLAGLTFSFVPSYSICYFFDLNDVFNKENKQTNYYSWDKYSWFLYIQGEKKQALDANQKAIEAWENENKLTGKPNSEFSQIPFILNKHKNGILNENWIGGYHRRY